MKYDEARKIIRAKIEQIQKEKNGGHLEISVMSERGRKIQMRFEIASPTKLNLFILAEGTDLSFNAIQNWLYTAVITTCRIHNRSDESEKSLEISLDDYAAGFWGILMEKIPNLGIQLENFQNSKENTPKEITAITLSSTLSNKPSIISETQKIPSIYQQPDKKRKREAKRHYTETKEDNYLHLVLKKKPRRS